MMMENQFSGKPAGGLVFQKNKKQGLLSSFSQYKNISMKRSSDYD
jgi:hypothetical protein